MASPPGSITPVMGASVTKIQGNDKELGSSMSTMYHPRTEGLSLAEVCAMKRLIVPTDPLLLVCIILILNQSIDHPSSNQ